MWLNVLIPFVISTAASIILGTYVGYLFAVRALDRSPRSRSLLWSTWFIAFIPWTLFAPTTSPAVVTLLATLNPTPLVAVLTGTGASGLSAARSQGASHGQIFRHIFLPQRKVFVLISLLVIMWWLWLELNFATKSVDL